MTLNSEEIQKIKEPYRSLIVKFVNNLLKEFKDKIISIAVFGSVARGDFKPTSDIDLIIIMKKPLPKSRMKRHKLISNILDKIEDDRVKLARKGIYTAISPIILDDEEAKYFRPLYLDLTQDAIIIYDKQNLLHKILQKLKQLIQEYEGERRWLGKQWYWIFKKGNPLIELCGVKLIE